MKRLVILAMLAASPALANDILPRHGGCPGGWNAQGNLCVRAGGRPAQVAIGGSCPGGWARSGSYCVQTSGGERNIVPRGTNGCPGGWSAQGGWCVAN